MRFFRRKKQKNLYFKGIEQFFFVVRLTSYQIYDIIELLGILLKRFENQIKKGI